MLFMALIVSLGYLCLDMTEQLKLVTNAQESKIFKTNATDIKFSNDFL